MAGLKVSTTVRWLDLDALRPSEDNPRMITVERFEALKRSIDADPGWLYARPVVARPDGRIVAGEMRWRAVCDLGGVLTRKDGARRRAVPGVVFELTDEQARLAMLRDNQEYGEWDQQALAELVYELAEGDANLDLSGFDESEVTALLASVAAGDEPNPPGEFPPVDPHADYRCPACGHGWSGHPRPGEDRKT